MQQEQGEPIEQNEVLERDIPALEPGEHAVSDAVPVDLLARIADGSGLLPERACFDEVEDELDDAAREQQELARQDEALKLSDLLPEFPVRRNAGSGQILPDDALELRSGYIGCANPVAGLIRINRLLNIRQPPGKELRLLPEGEALRLEIRAVGLRHCLGEFGSVQKFRILVRKGQNTRKVARSWWPIQIRELPELL